MQRTKLSRVITPLWALCVVIACGCDAAAPEPAADDEAARWQAKYEELVQTNETEIYPKLEQIEDLKRKNGELAERAEGLEEKLQKAREAAKQTETGRLRERVAQQDEQIEGLLAQIKQLKEQLTEARAAGGPNKAEAQLVLARAELAALGGELVDLGLEDEALAALERAVEIGEQGPEVLFRIGYVLAYQQRMHKAAEWYARAAEAAAKDPKVGPRLAAKIYNNYGATLVALARADEAPAWYEKAVAADAQYATVHFNLGRLYELHLDEAHRDKDKAIAAYRRHVALGGTRGMAARTAIHRIQKAQREGD